MSLKDYEVVMFVVNLLSALVICHKGIFHVLNAMTRHTYFPIRLAWLLMTTGAFAVLAAPVFGFYLTEARSTIIHVGVAVFVFSDRRFFRVKHA